ncbi:hypothetical protein FH972_021367 [Carpinus fangiana]|uniref:Beta-glucuronidase C-terminal domain-containing protein n=1 Tax=Carpinus fangiana TaxID=176857 RepID=A0A5N6KPH9_9ROSI|nr:hypothetical protein FH972_021367 [Carpinus fangiana]
MHITSLVAQSTDKHRRDYALYDAKLKVATNGTIIPSISPDFPRILFIGKSFFESYSTWPGTTYVHGFNLGKNGTEGRGSLLATVLLACDALGGGKLAHWELGNEPDLFKTSSQGPVRPSTWNETDYVREWLNGTRAIHGAIRKHCPDLAGRDKYHYIAPSLAGVQNNLNPVAVWSAGLDADRDITLISSHNYIAGATQPGVTLAGTLMNHTKTVSSIAAQLRESQLLSKYNLPYILGETNSLYNQGAPGLSNSFGAALWGLDFNLWCAANNISRVHMHQGLNYRYQSWQPHSTAKTAVGTKPPYYGQIAVAATLGNLTAHTVNVANLPLHDETQSAYATYEDGKLRRIAVINMHQFNYSSTSTPHRPTLSYQFKLPSECVGGKQANVRRLMANGSNADTGVTFNGFSYSYELGRGKPVRLTNVTHDEAVRADDHQIGDHGHLTLDIHLCLTHASDRDALATRQDHISSERLKWLKDCDILRHTGHNKTSKFSYWTKARSHSTVPSTGTVDVIIPRIAMPLFQNLSSLTFLDLFYKYIPFLMVTLADHIHSNLLHDENSTDDTLLHGHGGCWTKLHENTTARHRDRRSHWWVCCSGILDPRIPTMGTSSKVPECPRERHSWPPKLVHELLIRPMQGLRGLQDSPRRLEQETSHTPGL